MKKMKKNSAYAMATGIALAAITMGSTDVFAATTTHTVKSGDTLWSISQKYNIETDDLKEWNDIKNNTIKVGDKLYVSNPKKTTTTYTVKSGDTLYSIATKNKVTVSEIKKWNNLKSTTVYVGQKLSIGGSSASTGSSSSGSSSSTTGTTTTNVNYTVKSGDTLYGIATKYDISVDNIKSWNKLSSATVYVGQKLTIKKSGETSEPPKDTVVSTSKTGVVTADVLNVRATASTSGSIVTRLYVGAKVTITGESGNWYKIGQGWVSKDYIKLSTNGETATVTTYKVNATSLNLRASASTSANVLAMIPYGTLVNVTKTSDNWSYVNYDGLKGWVSSDYLVKPSAGSTGTSGAKHKTVIVDAGHGGYDPGAIGVDGTYEKTVVLATALKLRNSLQNAGYTVKMVRTSDASCQDVNPYGTNDLNCRTGYANAVGGDVFISVHANSATPAAKGTETYYSLTGPKVSQSSKLASNVHAGYKGAMASTDRGVRTANYYVIKYTNMPSILLELGFMTNSTDLSKMKNSVTQQNIAEGITRGVNNYFGY